MHKKSSSHHIIKELSTSLDALRVYVCGTCGKVFQYKHVLLRHEKIHTGFFVTDTLSDTTIYKTSCNTRKSLAFTTPSSFRVYKCSTCERTFKYKHVLVRHLRIHTGEKPFKCNLCNYQSNQKSNLITHMRTHSGERPFRF